MVTFSPLTTLADCRAVVALEEATWGAGAELVPASVLVASARRGGVLIGATEGERLVGFVWSMPGWRDGQPTHWSHMLAVAVEAQGHGLGESLKREQRDAVRRQHVELIEWTFDPLQAQNAHLNIHRLGAIATTYVEDAYGAMSGPLHHGTPTDRLIAEWWIERPHVVRRLAPRTPFQARSLDAATAPVVIATAQTGEWPTPVSVDLTVAGPRVRIPIPPRFTALQQQEPDLARHWRLQSRAVFATYFGRGYRVVDFLADAARGGTYLLAQPDPAAAPASEC